MIAIIFAAMLEGPASLPPPPYDKGPVTATIHFAKNANQACAKANGILPPPNYYIACYSPTQDKIILPYYCDPVLYKMSSFCVTLLRHELGHARGGMHKDGKWVKGYWRK